MSLPRTLVITSCTGEKKTAPPRPLNLDDFRDADRLRARERELVDYALPAGEMYTGMQHLRLMEGVHALRRALGEQAIDVAVLSAGYGLISEEMPVVPYDVTFNMMKAPQIDAWSQHLRINDAVATAVADYDLVLFLLGQNYLRALNLPVPSREDQAFVFLASNGGASRITGIRARTAIVPLTNAEAKRYRYGIIGLKGYLTKRFLEFAAQYPELINELHEEPSSFLHLLDRHLARGLNAPLFPELMRMPTSRSSTMHRRSLRRKPEPLQVPDVPVAPNVHLGMQYYIPESDDRVDPDYDFERDAHTADRDPHKHDVYAHEIFPRANYDGILVSRIVAEASRIKRRRIAAEPRGIHGYLKYEQGPVMGDCGAFGYIHEEVPPYEVDDIITYYQELRFDYGVSIDHLIVGPYAQPGVREKRFEITERNGLEFLDRFLERKVSEELTFTPIAAIQGWDPPSYARMAKTMIEHGYDYIGIGGLARSRTQDVIDVMRAVREHLRPETRVHLFGVARLDALPVLSHLGVTSFDSASPLRRAWLGSEANYHTISGKMYAAIRIPPADRGVRVKRAIAAGVATKERMLTLERDALGALRSFDAGEVDLESTLGALLAYDELMERVEDGRVDPEAQRRRRLKHETLYRELLSDEPWKDCACQICQEIGIDVVVFRGNNRNRRRGFHNTYVFYKRFQEIRQAMERMPEEVAS